ncbi:hypothetical protein [Listeria fleischmannii]|uniref:hypothetical protein n=1 Tax=Listeria fleischmannii TaxID=1069827 RepID=UPI000254F9B4|nr:hypothetical protein [Listeria fleischmannii]EIA21384.1 hypothetical protein KKC_01302 [Listeria fleischmannii subsp. coloradonensis]STY35292.1 Uncharacterised protein [Listeria fleischmannii subsp. coloradonensis]
MDIIKVIQSTFQIGLILFISHSVMYMLGHYTGMKKAPSRQRKSINKIISEHSLSRLGVKGK